MKKFIILLFVFTSLLTYSQFNRGGRNNQRQGQRQRQMAQTPQKAPEPKFEVEKYVGIVIYDIKKAAKKSSIKLSSDTGKQFSKTLTNYNKTIKDFKRINSFTLRSTKDMVENYQKAAMKSGDFSEQAKIQKKLAENLKPISETLKEEDKKLDTSIKKILSEKQYKKWIKYNKKMNKSFPKKDE